MEIVAEKRSSDWIAFVKGHREMWEAGVTEAEAVEKLRVTRSQPTPRVADGFWLCANCGCQNGELSVSCWNCGK